MPTNPPTASEIASLAHFSHRWLVQSHLDAGRTAEAYWAMHMIMLAPEVFAAYDKQIEAAFMLGYVMALAAKE